MPRELECGASLIGESPGNFENEGSESAVRFLHLDGNDHGSAITSNLTTLSDVATAIGVNLRFFALTPRVKVSPNGSCPN